MYFANHAVYRNSKSFSKTLMMAFHVTEFCKDDFYSFSLKASKQNKDVSQTQDRKPFVRSNSTSLKKLLLHYQSPKGSIKHYRQTWSLTLRDSITCCATLTTLSDRGRKKIDGTRKTLKLFWWNCIRSRKTSFHFPIENQKQEHVICVLANALVSGISNYECNVINTFQHLQAT